MFLLIQTLRHNGKYPRVLRLRATSLGTRRVESDVATFAQRMLLVVKLCTRFGVAFDGRRGGCLGGGGRGRGPLGGAVTVAVAFDVKSDAILRRWRGGASAGDGHWRAAAIALFAFFYEGP